MACVLSASDVESAVRALEQAYTELTLRVPARDERLRMSLESIDLSSVQAAELRISTSRLITGGYPCYTVCVPTRGRIRATADDTSSVVHGRRGLVVSPGSRVDISYLDRDCAVRTIRFDQRVVEAELSDMLGRPVHSAPRFDFALRTDPDNDAFQQALELLTADLGRPRGLAAQRPMAARLGRLVVSGLLLTQPHDYSDELHRPSGHQGPQAIGAVVEAIQDRPEQFGSVTELARVAALSVRALEEGFRRHVGMPPMAYLRQVRMARVHESLLAADPVSTTATSVAQRWGFAHYGRFAREYRGRYGCSPAQSLGGDRRPR